VSDELEQRLRDSLRAYAERVDPPDDGRLPAPRATPRPVVRRWRGAILAAAAAAAVVTGSLWVVADRDTGSDAGSAASAVASSAPGPAPAPQTEGDSGSVSDQALSGTAAAPAEGFGLPAMPEPGVAYAVDLYTHCGIRGIDIGGVWFAADPPLVEPGGNPPAGWGNPDQRGTVTLLSHDEAVFRDDAGHQVRLRADESARPPLCD
jgi:hypothetical protein